MGIVMLDITDEELDAMETVDVRTVDNKRGSILHTQNRPAKITLYLSYDKYKVNSDAII